MVLKTHVLVLIQVKTNTSSLHLYNIFSPLLVKFIVLVPLCEHKGYPHAWMTNVCTQTIYVVSHVDENSTTSSTYRSVRTLCSNVMSRNE